MGTPDYFRGPYMVGSQLNEPYRSMPYTFGEQPVQAAPTLVNDPPVDGLVDFSIANGTPPFVVYFGDGERMGISSRLFSRQYTAPGSYTSYVVDSVGRQSGNNGVTIP